MRRRSDRGSILLLAFLVMIVLYMLARAMVVAIPVEMNAANRLKNETAARYTAEAGIEDCVAWLEDMHAGGLSAGVPFVVAGPGSAVAEPVTGVERRSGELDGLAWEATIRPFPGPEHERLRPRAFLVESQALLEGQPLHRITAVVEQESLANYASFVDSNTEGGGEEVYFRMIGSGVECDGPYHTNDVFRLFIPEGYFTDSETMGGAIGPGSGGGSGDGAGEAGFQGPLTASGFYAQEPPGDGIQYVEGSELPVDGSGQPDEAKYRRLLKDGRAALSTGVEQRPLPSDFQVLEEAAYGGPVPTSIPDGSILLNGQAGIYVQGDVEIRLSVENQNPVLTFGQNQGVDVTRVIFASDNPVADGGYSASVGQTLVLRPDGSGSVVQGTGNGIVFVDGDIEGLSGLNKHGRTIVADPEGERELTIDGPLTRLDTPVGQKPGTHRDQLGLVAHEVVLANSLRGDGSGGAPEDPAYTDSNPLYLYANIHAGLPEEGGFRTESLPQESDGGQAFVHLYGSLCQGTLLPLLYSYSVDSQGTSRTRPTYGGGGATESYAAGPESEGESGWYGFQLRLFYDPASARHAPPGFPALMRFVVRTWEEERLSR
ncbi:MAG: hypothetical protein HY319_30500 [Armatimonadetes bacterium]|nr:hypothetical protein [Armatimonadota bacterium]